LSDRFEPGLAGLVANDLFRSDDAWPARAGLIDELLGGQRHPLAGPAGHGMMVDDFALQRGAAPRHRGFLMVRMHYAIACRLPQQFGASRRAAAQPDLDPYINRHAIALAASAPVVAAAQPAPAPSLPEPERARIERRSRRFLRGLRPCAAPTQGSDYEFLYRMLVGQQAGRYFRAASALAPGLADGLDYPRLMARVLDSGRYDEFRHFVLIGDRHLTSLEYLLHSGMLDPSLALVARSDGARLASLPEMQAHYEDLLGCRLGDPVVVLQLGEGDCRATDGICGDPQGVAAAGAAAATRYAEFLDRLRSLGYRRFVLIGALEPHWRAGGTYLPTPPRETVATATNLLNREIAALATTNGMRFLDPANLVDQPMGNHLLYDDELHYAPSRFGPLFRRALSTPWPPLSTATSAAQPEPILDDRAA
jgi:hypothetical protein